MIALQPLKFTDPCRGQPQDGFRQLVSRNVRYLMAARYRSKAMSHDDCVPPRIRSQANNAVLLLHPGSRDAEKIDSTVFSSSLVS